MKKNKIIVMVIILFVVIIFLIVYLACNKKLTNNNKFIDNTKPIINVINEEVYIDGDSNFDPLDNIKVEYNNGCKVKCNNKLKVGDNIIKCTVKKNNLKASASYKVIMSKTYQKKAIFFGDSIVAGFMSSGYSWANYIGDNYDLSLSINAGITDYRVSTYDDASKWLVDEVKSHYSDSDDYDFVILEGGVNDVLYNTPMGEISNNKDLSSFDPKTYCGGLESYLYYVTNKWKTSRIGYIITYYTPNYTERGMKWSYDDYKKYNDKTIEILNKWNIKYLNLATDEFNNLLKVEERTYLPDYLHLNSEGYKVLSPYIYNFMQTLDKYS